MKNLIIILVSIFIFIGCSNFENPISQDNNDQPSTEGKFVGFLPDYQWINDTTFQVSPALAPNGFNEWNKIQYWWIEMYDDTIKIDSKIVKESGKENRVFYFSKDKSLYNWKNNHAKIYTYIN